MPNAYIKKLSKEGKGSEAELEHKYKKAESIAAKEGKGDNFGYITGIFQKMIGERYMKFINKCDEILTEGQKFNKALDKQVNINNKKRLLSAIVDVSADLEDAGQNGFAIKTYLKQLVDDKINF